MGGGRVIVWLYIASWLAMGNRSSSEILSKDEVEGNSTMVRAIARGRVYVAIRYPRSVDSLKGTLFNDPQFRVILTELQQVSGG